jgi:3-methyladenine DNA glycosylase AlkD
MAYVIRLHPQKEALRQRWMTDAHPMAARAGWSLTTERLEKSPKNLDIDALLQRIEAEMADADPAPQWTMNACLATIGIHFPERRARAIEIGERLGVYRKYPVSKGCTSPFAPIWIEEMVRRQKATPSGGK